MKKVASAVARCVAVIAVSSLAGCALFGPHAGIISGTITIAGYPVQGVTVTVGSAVATTDSNGNYTLQGLGNGSYTVTPSLKNYSFAPLSSTVKVNGTGATTGINFDAGPQLPVPLSYSQNVTSPTSPVLIAVKPLGPGLGFSPTINGGWISTSPAMVGATAISLTTPYWIGTCESVPANGSYTSWIFAGNSTGQQVSLIDSAGTIVPNPQANVYAYVSGSTCAGAATTSIQSFEPLTQKPLLELTAFWQLVGGITRYANSTNTTVSQTVTYGVSQSSTQNFSNTIKASAGVNIDGFSASISDTFSQSTSNSMSITQSNSQTDTFQVTMPSNKEGVYGIWQLVYQVAIVRKATAAEISNKQDAFGNRVDSFGYVLFSDPNFTNGSTDAMSSTDLAPVDIYQQNDVVPLMTLFTP